MEHHGSESYYVLGEGLLAESRGGRPHALAAATEAVTPPFRFSRLGPNGVNRQLGLPNLRKIGTAMAQGGGPQAAIPAGFTYLGQFVDHDLTFDRTTVTLGTLVSPAQLLQARSPSLDLDSLYGAGPTDPQSARFYDADGLHLKVGTTVAAEGVPPKPGHDLPRGAGTTAAARRRAVIPDPRNDENLAVAQTHLAFIRFHNRVVDTLPASVPPAQRFAEARAIVTRHYQWMLRTDFLPRVCAPAAVNDVFANGRKAFEVGVPATDVPTMPIEFSVAAYRLGHSMVRAAYEWNRIFASDLATLGLLFEFSGGSGTLGGQPRLPSSWIADFRRLYDFKEAGRMDLAVPASKFNRARRIDTRLVVPLGFLPAVTEETNLAIRNLVRGRMVRLATGQQMAAFLRSKGLPIATLTAPQLRNGNGGADLARLTPLQRQALVRDTPLWFYILREAELNAGGRLKGVGARIVAETFHRAMEGSTISIVREPTWRPTLGPDPNTFRMVDLLLFAFEGSAAKLNPVGP